MHVSSFDVLVTLLQCTFVDVYADLRIETQNFSRVIQNWKLLELDEPGPIPQFSVVGRSGHLSSRR